MSINESPLPGGLRFAELDPARDSEAAGLLEANPELLGGRSAAERIAAARTDPNTDLIAGVVDDRLAVIYLLRRVHLMNELDLLLVAPAFRRRGFGRSAVVDAVQRSGRRPVALECSEELFGYFQSIGCKIVGKRRGPDGELRYRLGAHTPKSGKKN